EIAGGDGDVGAEAERVVLIDPGVVTGLDTELRLIRETRPGELVQRPALRTLIAGSLGSVQRALALAAVELAQVAAAKRHPHHAVAVYVCPTHAEAGQRHVVDLAELRTRVETNQRAGKLERHRSPHRAVGRVGHDRVERARDALIELWIRRLTRLDPFIAAPVAIGIQNKRCPPL